MKKLIIAIFVATGAALFITGCMPKVDTAKEQAQIDSLANVKIAFLRDSLKMNCADSIVAWAHHKADSMWMAALKAGKPKPKPVAPAPPTNTSTTTGDPKKDKMSGNNEASTQEKKDKMTNADSTSTQKKKDKMKPK